MSNALNRFIKSHSGVATTEGDWLTLNKLTEGSEQIDPSGLDEEGNGVAATAKTHLLTVGSAPRWLNFSNVTETLLLRDMFGATNSLFPQTVDADFVDEGIKLGASVIQAVEAATKVDDVEAASLAIPYRDENPLHVYFGAHPSIEIVFDAIEGFNKIEFLRKVVLPRQVPTIRRRFVKAQIFTVCRCFKQLELFMDHGWQNMEPDFEFIIKWERRGARFKSSDHWLIAP
ncbi:hypothetical protein So717_43320 [Roseobacter cerasinus]|uniref:Uncharacterized protein n=1 Tax=Roseobacter cerasinus TaxID=2602289 RepID=A0A640VX30_9RHOB|nr:hypothetical protein [Roseobacter cerasinus]GFE52579.1 hypothetical protein So717_43320 [Roseobacter cerasinus]